MIPLCYQLLEKAHLWKRSAQCFAQKIDFYFGGYGISQCLLCK
uniref:Uncharacterized protein n=1 Tax=Arundo donax TaxID=35708 RepID=A0A0A9ES25_ARUDO